MLIQPTHPAHYGSYQINWCRTDSLWPNFCRPIKFMFAKEASTIILTEQTAVESYINGFVPFDTSVNGIDLHVSFEFLFTTFDGIACSTLSHEKAAAKCCIRGAIPKDINNSEVNQKPENTANLRYGLSVLYCLRRLSVFCILLMGLQFVYFSCKSNVLIFFFKLL